MWIGQGVSVIGRQITLVAAPYQVYQMTHSTLLVGLLSLAQFVPLLIASFYAGALADSHDRRLLLMLSELAAIGTTVPLALVALATSSAPVVNGPVPPGPVLVVFLLSALASTANAIELTTRHATVPRLVDRIDLSRAVAVFQIRLQLAMVIGPVIGGFIIAHLSLAAAYLTDTLTGIFAIGMLVLMRPIRPLAGNRPRGLLRAPLEGMRFALRQPVVLALLAADLAAMGLALPRALFPALADTTFHVGAEGLGLLYGALGAGALVMTLFTGWVGSVRHPGAAILIAVAAWAAAITAFGLITRLGGGPVLLRTSSHSYTLAFAGGLLLLAAGGAADMYSSVFRQTLLQLLLPDQVRGRVSSLYSMVIAGGPRLGDLRAGVVATLAGAPAALVAGGLTCLAAVALIWRLVPGLTTFDAWDPPAISDPASPGAG